jgi:acetyl-CoA synthetase
MCKNFNFGYDIIDARAAKFPNKIAVKSMINCNFTLKMSNADLHHHSDITAYYLQQMGIKKFTRVLLCGLENSFELAVILTALHKLCAVSVFDLLQNSVNCANSIEAYAIIATSNSPAIQQVMQNISTLKTVEILISTGANCPEYWFDLHTGTRFSKTFKPLKKYPENCNSVIIFDETPKFFNEKYPLETQTNYFFDNFYRAMLQNEIWIC